VVLFLPRGLAGFFEYALGYIKIPRRSRATTRVATN
jgi:hypothetical protein